MGSGALSDAVHAWDLLKEVTTNPIIELPELTQDWETDSWQAKTEPCVHQDPGERRAVTPQETDPGLPMSIQESLAEVWIGSGLLQGWGHYVQQCIHGTF